MGLVLLVAGRTGLPLSWDGAGYLYDLLQQGNFQLPVPFRQAQVFFQWPVLLLRTWGLSVGALTVVYCLTYALIPLAVLHGCWWALPREKKELVIWPFLTLGIGTIWGQLYFISETSLAPLIAWPAVICAITKRHLWSIPLTLAFSFFLNPTSAAPLAMVGLVFIFDGAPVPRRTSVALGGGCLALLLVRIMLVAPGYEESQTSWAMIKMSYFLSLHGKPLIGICLAFLLGALLVQHGVSRATTGRGVRLAAYSLAALIVLNLGLWVFGRTVWLDLSRFRIFSFLVHLGFYLLAWVHGRFLPAAPSSRRLLLHLGVFLPTLTFAGVVLVQGRDFWHDRAWLRSLLSETPRACIDYRELVASGKARFRIFHSFYYSPVSILLQDTRTPPKVLLGYQHSCEDAEFTRRIPTGFGRLEDRSEGQWFDLRTTGL